MIIFLIGFMGSGKTTLGKQLAKRLGYCFIDQDEVIENKFQMSVSEIFAKYGEEKFRETENNVLKEIIKNTGCIVATGGGAPCFHDNLQLMNTNGFTIYLKVDPEVIVQRLKDTHNLRPLVRNKTEKELLDYTRQMLTERTPFYSAAKLILYSKDLTVDDIFRALEDMHVL
jgi:shikimate kinase